MGYQLRNRPDGQVEIVENRPVVVGVFADHGIAVRVLQMLTNGVAPASALPKVPVMRKVDLEEMDDEAPRPPAWKKPEPMTLTEGEKDKAFERIAACRASTRCSADTRMTKLVVALALLLVFQHLVGFVYLFELGLIAALFVGVMLDRTFSKGFFNLILRGGFGHAQYFIIIPLCHIYLASSKYFLTFSADIVMVSLDAAATARFSPFAKHMYITFTLFATAL